MKEERITDNLTKPFNQAQTQLEILKKHFPNCFDKEGNFKLESFKEEIKQNEVSFSSESYGIEWLGKAYARVLLNEPAQTLLKEDKIFNQQEENQNAQNLLFRGDNLEVLKHLTNVYYEKIKMIYIDPPYNTGSNGFVYNDDRTFSIRELQQLAGINGEKAKRILDFVKSKSNSHSAWLTFMYPRLYIARQLLKDDGVIFVSIDDNEVAQLRLLLDEIFGEENFVAELPTVMNLKGNNDEFGFAGTHEYTICYAKNKESLVLNEFIISDDELEDWQEDEYGFYKQGANLKATGTNAPREKRPNLFFPVFIDNDDTVFVTENNEIPNQFLNKEKDLITLYPITNNQEMSWRWSKEKFLNEKHNLIISRNGSLGIYKKQRPTLGDLPSKKPKTIFYKPQYSSGNGTAQIKELFNDKFFSNPKPIKLIKDLIQIGTFTSNSDLILDFFAGSGTSGDAVMRLNAEDGGNRKFILVQLDEKIDKKSNKTAFDFVKNELKIENPTIFDITKERLIRAAQKIKTESNEIIQSKEKEINQLSEQINLKGNQEKITTLQSEIEHLKTQDVGFQVFESIPMWEDYLNDEEDLTENTTLFDEKTLTEEDIQTLLTTWTFYDGILPTQKPQKIDLGGYSGYLVQTNLYLMHTGFKTKHLVNLIEKLENDSAFVPSKLILFGYNFDSKNLKEIGDNLKQFINKKSIDLDLLIRH